MIEREPDFRMLDGEESGVDVAKGDYGEGTFYLQTNSPQGGATIRIALSPRLAGKLRDWLSANYPLDCKANQTVEHENTRTLREEAQFTIDALRAVGNGAMSHTEPLTAKGLLKRARALEDAMHKGMGVVYPDRAHGAKQ